MSVRNGAANAVKREAGERPAQPPLLYRLEVRYATDREGTQSASLPKSGYRPTEKQMSSG
jgi:hypothetical protein